MARKLRVVVIGAGAIAQRRHLPEYAAREEVELIGLVDIKKDRAEEVAAKFGIPAVFTDYRQALKLKPDAVSVCTPNAYHARQAIDSFKAGAHVLVEKPMALSVKEAKAMIAAAKAARRQLMVGHNQRFAPAHVAGKALFQSGQLGKVLSFRTTFVHGGPEGWSVDGLKCQFFKKKEAGLGSLADLGVHKLDMLRWLLEEDFVEAAGMLDTLQKKKCDVEDIAVGVLKTASGALGTMTAGWISRFGGNATVLLCEKGSLRLEDDPEFTVIAQFNNGQQTCIKTKGIQTNDKGGQYSSGVIDAFVDALLSGKPNPIPGEDGARSLAAVLACVESARTGRIVKVAKI